MTIHLLRNWRMWSRRSAPHPVPSLLINTLAQLGTGLAGIACGGDLPSPARLGEHDDVGYRTRSS